MDNIFELGDFFGGESGNVNPLVLILSVLMVVVGAVAVFIFGFKESEPPKIRRRSSDISSKIKKLRKIKKAKTETVPPQKEAGKTALQQKPAKKEAAITAKSKVAPEKPATTTAAVAAKKSGTAVAASTVKAAKNETKKVRGAAKKASNGKEMLPAKSSDKTLNNTVADGEDWQTVTTKKQKKSTESLNQSSVLVDAAAKVINSKENVKSPKNKQAKEKANKTKKATSVEQQKMQEIGTQTTVENISVDVVENKVATAPVAVAVQADLPDALLDLAQIRANALKAQQPAKVEAAVEAIEVHAVNGQGTYGTADEMEDPGWTEATAPKKIKKRALRE